MSDGLQQFRWAVLGAWENDRTAACSAAAEAMYAAVVLHADKPKGTVLVAVPHQPDVRSVATYLTAFLTDAPQLSRVLHKIGTDGEVMVAGKRILILPTVTSRRPRNILANVEMADTVDAVVELKSDAEIARTVAHILLPARRRSCRTGPSMPAGITRPSTNTRAWSALRRPAWICCISGRPRSLGHGEEDEVHITKTKTEDPSS
jgi:hypothetical protein